MLHSGLLPWLQLGRPHIHPVGTLTKSGGLPLWGGEWGKEAGEGPRGVQVPSRLWAQPRCSEREDSGHSGGVCSHPIYYFY